jgi:hypothetical protein
MERRKKKLSESGLPLFYSKEGLFGTKNLQSTQVMLNLTSKEEREKGRALTHDSLDIF